MALRLQDAHIYVAGHRGLVGSALVRALERQGCGHVTVRTRAELDLADAAAVDAFFAAEKPEVVFLAAAKVGGILANKTHPVSFLLENLTIQNNVLMAAYRAGVTKTLFLGSSCIYPREAPQPIPESALLGGHLEPTNDAYAIAKIAGIKLCQALRAEHGADFISVMPTNLYGPNDNYDLEQSHVLPALIRKFHVAKYRGQPAVTVWGTGSPKREFLHADDLAEACLHLMETYSGSDIVNIGTGEDVTIRELALLVKDAVGYDGALEWDSSKPDGTPRKLLDVSKLHSLGWRHHIELADGIRSVYAHVDTAEWITPR